MGRVEIHTLKDAVPIWTPSGHWPVTSQTTEKERDVNGRDANITHDV